MAVADS